jgi:hypothetical protein
MKRKLLFLFFCTIFVGSLAKGQNIIPKFNIPTFNTTPVYSIKPQTFSLQLVNEKRNISPSMLVSPTFYCSNLAFFCRQEIKFEKITKIPFKFRLGSVQYVDYLEGKRGALLTR